MHPDGNVFRDLVIRRGDVDVQGAVAVEGTYEIGMQDQASWDRKRALAIPAAERRHRHDSCRRSGLHNDRDQFAECLGIAPDLVRLTLGGVGGAFGAREDVSMHIHALPARPADGAAGEDRVLPGRVVPRSRAPASGPAYGCGTRRVPTATL